MVIVECHEETHGEKTATNKKKRVRKQIYNSEKQFYIQNFF